MRLISSVTVSAVVAALLIVFVASPTRAGVAVTSAGGSIAFDFTPPTDPPLPNSHSFTATVPGSNTIDFTEPFSGDTGRVSYNIALPGGGLHADLEARIQTSGIAPEGKSQFLLEFTTDVPLHFRFAAHPVDFGPQFFESKLDDITANARVSALGDVSGTIPFNEFGVFGEFVREGTLPAGEHSFSIESDGQSSRSGGGASAGLANLDVTAVAVPLPPAVWAAGSVLAALGLAHTVRRGNAFNR